MRTGDKAIVASSLEKTYRARVGTDGFSGLLRSLYRPEYRDVQAVHNVTLEVFRGERVAFIGRNGAGKSTTIKMLTGILHPTSGEASVLNLNPWRERRKLSYKIGVVFGQRSQLWYHLSSIDTYRLLAKVYEIPNKIFKARLGELVELFDIAPLLQRPVRSLSLGQRMRCELVASLLHSPEILFLDEPTIGLDVQAKATIRELITNECKRWGATVFLTSHDTGDIEKVCERVVLIDHGTILLDLTIDQLRQRYITRKVLNVHLSEPDFNSELPGVTVLEKAPHEVKLGVDIRLTTIQATLSSLLSESEIRDITVEDPPLEEIMRQIYEESDVRTAKVAHG